MEVEITSVRENPLLGRRDAELRIQHEGEPTPGGEDVVSRVAAENNLEEENVEVEGIHTGFGSNVSEAQLKIFEEFEYNEELEQEAVEEDETSSAATEEYEEIVSGTITEAKEQLEEMDDPDYGEALEAEKQNKDRKTLVEWLNNKA